MYEFVTAVVRERSIGAQWKETDISNILVFDIYNAYSKVYLELSSIYIEGSIFVDFDTLRAEFSSYQGTLNQLLIALGNRTLEQVEALPSTQIKFARYSDAIQANYKINTCKVGVSIDTPLPEPDKTDLYVQRPKTNTDVSLIHKNCLVSVNGYFHMTDTDETYTYVLDGGKTMRKSRMNHMGILSFLDIGDVKKVPIKEENIFAQEENSNLKTRTYVHIDEDIENKTVLLVLGGYLIFPDRGSFWQSGDRSFAINFSSMPILERFFESKNYLDLDALGLDISQANPDMINVDEFLSDDVLKKYLTLSQSFFVIIDSPNFFTNRIFLKHSAMPGMFTAYQDPSYPLIVGYGKSAEYWKTFEDGYWSVNVQDSFFRNYVFTYKPIEQLKNITPNAVPSQTFFHSRGYLLEIGSFN